jgi:hypothetical protein
MESLMQALQFTGDDLAANRRGAIGPFQAERLRRALRRAFLIGFVVLALGVLLAAAALYFGDRNDDLVLTLIGIALTVFNAAVVGYLAQWWLRTRMDLERPLLVAEGLVHRTVRARPNGQLLGFVLRLEGQPLEVRVNRPVFNAFSDGATYRLYRAAGSRQLLSAEEVDRG